MSRLGQGGYSMASASDPEFAGHASRELTLRLQEAAIRRSTGSSRFRHLSTQLLGILDR
jgi:hypothetical protein